MVSVWVGRHVRERVGVVFTANGDLVGADGRDPLADGHRIIATGLRARLVARAIAAADGDGSPT